MLLIGRQTSCAGMRIQEDSRCPGGAGCNFSPIGPFFREAPSVVKCLDSPRRVLALYWLAKADPRGVSMAMIYDLVKDRRVYSIEADRSVLDAARFMME